MAKETYSYWHTSGMLASIGLFCHMKRSLSTLVRTSGMLVSIGLVCYNYNYRPLLPYEDYDTCADLRYASLNRPLLL